MPNNAFTIVKLGGSIITDKSKPYTPNLKVLERLAKEIKESNAKVIIIHGQGSFAHTSAKKYGGKKGYKSRIGISEVFKDAMEINRIVIDSLFNAGIPVVSFRPGSLFLADKGKLYSHNLRAVFEAINQGLVPVLYGDVIMDKSWKTTIFSGETTVEYLVSNSKKKIPIKQVIQVGVTSGVFDEKGEIIPIITNKNYNSLKKNIFGSSNTDVTGGMKHKVDSALRIAQSGVPTYIIDGTIPNNLLYLLNGKKIKSTKVS